MNEDILAAARRQRPPVGAKTRVRRAVALSVAVGTVTAAVSASAKSGIFGIASGKAIAMAALIAAVGASAVLVSQADPVPVTPIAKLAPPVDVATSPANALENLGSADPKGPGPLPVTKGPGPLPVTKGPGPLPATKGAGPLGAKRPEKQANADTFSAAVETLERAQMALAAGDYEKANTLAASLRESPFLREVLFLRAVAACGLGHAERAATHLKTLSALDPKLHERAIGHCQTLGEKK